MSVTLFIQHEMRMRCSTLSSAASPAIQYFSMLSHKVLDFRKKLFEHKIPVLTLSTIFVWNMSWVQE